MKEIAKEHIDEFLELLFVAKEEDIQININNIPDKLPCFDAGVELKGIDIKSLADICINKQYIEFDNAGVVKLKEIGLRKATSIVRKHRIAERLLLDILDLHEVLMEKNACVFEHHLASVVTDRICTILNHPPVCPHNKPIPRGKCCQQQTDKFTPAVIPLNEASLNLMHKVIFTKDFDTKTFLTMKSFGIYPGATIKILQKYPEILLEIENSKVALERRIADKIFLLPLEEEPL